MRVQQSNSPTDRALIFGLLFLSFSSCVPHKIAGYAAKKLMEATELKTASGAGTTTTTTSTVMCTANTDRGVWDLTTAFPGDGVFSGVSNAPSSSSICTGSTIVGTAGSASCGASSTFDALMASGIHRDKDGTPTQLTISGEKSAADTLTSGYREIPNTNKDDDGYGGTSVSMVVRGTTVWNGAVPRVACGMGIATVAARITDCDTQHTTKPSWDASSSDGKISWDGAVKGNAAQGSWTLVTVYDASLSNGTTCGTTCREVWRDDRTGLLWSDKLGDLTANGNAGVFNWCLASGNTEDNANGLECRTNQASSYNNHNNVGTSLCAEEAGVTTPVGVHNVTTANNNAAWANTGTSIRDAKGGMLKTLNSDPSGSAQSPSVRWRLPTKYDYQQADNDGIRHVLPNSAGNFWSASVYAGTRSNAWYFNGDYGNVYSAGRSTALAVRCVGR